jgi:hydroxymethylglutaryl-CoA reductase
MAEEKKRIKGFSKLSKTGKIKWIVENFFIDPEAVLRELKSYWHSNEDQQKILDGFSENTISNYPMPYGVAPNFVINGKTYCVPMVIEESSVVAAASSGAKFWMTRGGFKTEILGTKKVGQVHFKWKGDINKLRKHFEELKEVLLNETIHLTDNMRKRGGGVLDIELVDFSDAEPDYYQLRCYFETVDSMGANFINSVLEAFAIKLEQFVLSHPAFEDSERDVLILMSILSNYTPECLVRASVECNIDDLGVFPGGMDSKTFADKFNTAVAIAHIDRFRATTHNKGIFNGIDAVVIATANDFRAIEACGHSYAARSGRYESLSYCSIKNNIFKFWLDIPLAIGTVGGLTNLHPIAKRSLELLGNPGATELMQIIAATGLAQNFSAVRSLVTTGIQKGHMKMHLKNILNQLEATEGEKTRADEYFATETVSFSAVRAFLKKIRKHSQISAS